MYLEAAAVINNVLKRNGSLKNLVYSSPFQNKKALFALSCETLRYRLLLIDIAIECGLLKDKKLKNNENLLAVLLYEHILGKGIKGKYKMLLQRHKSSLHSRCERLKMDAGMTDIKETLKKLLPTSNEVKTLPKYVRMNTLCGKPEDIMKELQQNFHLLTENNKSTSLDEPNQFICDVDITNVLVFHPSVQLHHHPMYLSGKLIIQDKASCFPAFILNPPPGSSVIDCCAAPGNKTTHLAAIIKNKGTVFAFDKDPKRLKILQKMVGMAKASCVKAECKDFLAVDTMDERYQAVEYILVDPSCSGSGMINRQQQFTDEDESCSAQRLQQLSKFQISILKHALNFPRVKRVVYSTCSIHEQENEQVVEEVYSQLSDEFDVVNIMPHWKFRGKEKYTHGRNCLRMSYDDCQTNGFFVACFERKTLSEDTNGGNEQSFSCSQRRSTKLKNLKDIQNVLPFLPRQNKKNTSGYIRATSDWNVMDV